MASSSSSTRPSWNHDVFLSFRGEDTRKTFVDHLYTSLVQQGIYTYKDDEELPRGESIGSALMKAIRESRIAVIVFSENYADSSWCLDEVVYIMKCMDERRQIVMPIFYHVDPSEVRKQTGKYGEIFAKYESQNNEKAELWRKALVSASNLAGWEPKNIANGHESKGIKEIVDTILDRLAPLISNVNKDLTGIRIRLQDLKTHLELGSNCVRMVGIWGVGGGGKTTLASSVYDEISSQFDGCCLVENIREKSQYGLEKLQETILSCVLKQKQVEVRGIKEGREMIKHRLCRRKVLIVLDDVDHLDHLEALVGSHDWFGEGSRVIITTRDNHLLKAHKVNVIHNISLLNNDEAIKLFHKHAPRGDRHVEDYETYSKKVVSYAGGLPLALKVLGSFLCDKEMNEWRSTLDRLEDIPETDILNKLKISYDGLKQVEKELFLDIACFFRGPEYREYSLRTLDACGFHPVIGVKVLIQKALVTISYGKFSSCKFDMHDLVQEMGHHIVRGEHPNNPEMHSRVWKREDVRKICAMDGSTTELDKIEAIRIPLNLSLNEEPFRVVAKMKNLRWFSLNDDYILWFSACSFPTNFQPVKLCCLELGHFTRKRLWKGYKYLPNLRMMRLHNFDKLTETPDFSGLPNLETFMLYGATRLKEIHPSIGRLEKLVYLSVRDCYNLKTFPPVTSLKKLETLVISRCKLGDEDISSDVWELSNLEKLDLSGNTFTRMNLSNFKLPRLKLLDVSRCEDLVELAGLPSSIAVLKADNCNHLEVVQISNCKWLWKVSLLRHYKFGPIGGDVLLRSMLEGIAIEDHFISLACSGHYIPKRFVGRLVRGKKFTFIPLPHNWEKDFCGFLICVVSDTHWLRPYITITHELEGDFRFEGPEEESDYTYRYMYLGYISFSSLRNTASWNSSSTKISFLFEGIHESLCGVELVDRKSDGDQVQTRKVPTDCSGFWDEEVADEKTFTIRHDSKSSMNILWNPVNLSFESIFDFQLG